MRRLKQIDRQIKAIEDAIDLQLPARPSNGELVWKRPSYRMVHRLLTNPAYGGAYDHAEDPEARAPAQRAQGTLSWGPRLRTVSRSSRYKR